jgi:hypothetical protein
VVGKVYFYEKVKPKREKKALEVATRNHADAAAKRVEQCQGIDWLTACQRLTLPGARRLDYSHSASHARITNDMEDEFLHSEDPTVTYDENCLRVYRLHILGEGITFPYHASQLLRKGGNQTMALFIQHGAMRNSQDYWCSFARLMKAQQFRPFSEILVIAPDFNYEYDPLVHPNDAFWNSSKPWGDWRVGAQSDPKCCGGTGLTVSSFHILDHMLGILTNKRLYPNMQKISYVGHSAGGQMVQRYAILSVFAALWDYDADIDLQFVIANPSSYTYLDDHRFMYACGNCTCCVRNCTCDQDCTEPPYTELAKPQKNSAGKKFPCYSPYYNRWPYGIGSFSEEKRGGHSVPYALRDGILGVEKALRIYPKLHVVYLVGQNDTCNDGLPTCDASCWKRENFSKGEWACFRNQMDSRCPAMLQGPCRRTRGRQYMKYLEDLYGEPVHQLFEVPGIGHNATGMFMSPIGLKVLFG